MESKSSSALTPEQRKQLLAYLAGLGNAAEKALAHELILAHWDDPEVVQLLLKAWNEGEGEISELAKQQVKSALIKAYRQDRASLIVSLWGRPGYRWAIAASLFICLAGAYYFVFTSYRTTGKPATFAQEVTTNKEDLHFHTAAKTPGGKRASIILADGSKISLNAASTLNIVNGYNSSRRIVQLQGEGFFEVKPDPEHPFIVYANKQQIAVLGTSFNVRAYPEDAFESVGVVTGKVAVGDSGGLTQPQVLLPGNLLSRSGPTGIYQLTTVRPSSLAGWRNGVLSFSQANIFTITHELERWYGVSIQLTGANGDCKYDASFANQPLSTVLNSLAFLIGFSYEQKGNNILIKEFKCQ